MQSWDDDADDRSMPACDFYKASSLSFCHWHRHIRCSCLAWVPGRRLVMPSVTAHVRMHPSRIIRPSIIPSLNIHSITMQPWHYLSQQWHILMFLAVLGYILLLPTACLDFTSKQLCVAECIAHSHRPAKKNLWPAGFQAKNVSTIFWLIIKRVYMVFSVCWQKGSQEKPCGIVSKDDMKSFGLTQGDAQEKDDWRVSSEVTS